MPENRKSGNTIAAQIEKQLQHVFQPTYLILLNESQQHAGPATESHFNLVMVSNSFTNQNLLKRQRSVFAVLKIQMQQIHALTMKLHTPEEWAQLDNLENTSPQCLGRSK